MRTWARPTLLAWAQRAPVQVMSRWSLPPPSGPSLPRSSPRPPTSAPPVDAAGGYASDAGRWLRAALDGYDALLIGCGLGQSADAQALVRDALLSASPLPKPAVVDADALNALARIPGWHQRLRGSAVVTPHPGELSRLLQRPVAAIEANRWGSAREAAQRWGLVVVPEGSLHRRRLA